MAKYQYLQSNFSGGEIGKRLFGRPDSDEYQSGARLMMNVLTAPEGGFYRRSGTRFMFDPSKILTAAVTNPRFIEFVYNGDSYFMLWNPFQSNSATLGIQCYKFRPDLEIAFNTFPFEGITMTAAYGTYLLYDNMHTPTAAPTGEVDDFVYIQIGNFVYVTHTSGLYMPIEFEITTNAAGSVEVKFKPLIFPISGPFGEGRREPFRTPNVDQDIKFSVSDPGATALQTITVNVQNLATAAVDYFEKGALWLGTLFKITVGSVTGIYYVDSVPSNSSAIMKAVDVVTGAVGLTDNWEVSQFNQVYGFPKAMTGYDQRLYFGNTKDKPNFVWGSAVQNTSLFMINMLAQDLEAVTDVSKLGYFGKQTVVDPVAFGIVGNENVEIRWLNSGDELHVGTSSGEYSLKGGTNVILSRDYVSSSKHSSMGGKYFPSISIGNTSLFISREGKRALLFRKDPETLALSTVDLNIVNPDVIFNGVDYYDTGAIVPQLYDTFDTVEFVKAAYQRDKHILWFRMKPTGQLISLVIDVSARKAAWHRHTLGGKGVLNYPPYILDIMVIPNTATGNDDVFLIMNRSGTVVIEKMGTDFYDYIQQAGPSHPYDRMIFMDSTVKGIPALVGTDYEISGLDHLDGEEVRVVYGNVMVDPKKYTVAAGKITVAGEDYPSIAVDPIWVGLEYTSRVRMLPPDFGAQAGSAIGLPTRYSDIIVRYFNSGNFWYGSDLYEGVNTGAVIKNLYEARIEGERDSYMGVKETIASLYSTGVKQLAIESSHSRDPDVLIEITDPKPLYVQSVTLRGKVNEG